MLLLGIHTSLQLLSELRDVLRRLGRRFWASGYGVHLPNGSLGSIGKVEGFVSP
jgi:hypothetical protein